MQIVFMFLHRLCAAAILLLCCHGHAKDLPTPGTYLITRTTTPPIIDGELNDEPWSQVKRTTSFIIHDSGNPSPINTFAQLARDDQYLYLATTCEDTDIFSHHTQNQAPLYRRDDLVEIFIDPDGDGKNYIEIGFSANAVHYSLMVPEVINGKINPELLDIPKLLYATRIHGTLNNPADQDLYWTLEARIPLAIVQAQQNPSLPNNSWRLGLFRIDYNSHSKTNQADGYYAWQYIGQFGFHRPERFGYVTFKNRAIP